MDMYIKLHSGAAGKRERDSICPSPQLEVHSGINWFIQFNRLYIQCALITPNVAPAGLCPRAVREVYEKVGGAKIAS